ncbi:hypothetical protein O6H91_10G078300 [Diphasiastrum complanatum]|uniref:Uncharacterized protein n=1 Tax=Diphasiastrum complanatum TaxID=34168 RepID=A0ACC2CIP3_DIPCM|nr:hypothetical protein O6H91_10G078300 [Diphasiastrum complanatum]
MAADQLTRPKTSSNAIHLVLFPFPAQGHMIPLMQLGNVLAFKGLIITFVCAEHRVPLMQEAEYRGQYHPNLRIVTLPDAVPPGEHGVDEGTDSVTWSITGTQKMVDPFKILISDLIQSTNSDGGSSSSPPLGIISDYALSWTQDVADEFSIPRYIFFPSAASGLLFMFYVPTLVAKGQLPLSPSLGDDREAATKEESYIYVPGLPPVRKRDVSSAWQATSQQWLQRFSLRNAERLHEAAGILVNSFCALDADAIIALRSSLVNPKMVSVRTVGPLLPRVFFDNHTFSSCSPQDGTLEASQSRCLHWLDTQRTSSVIYISFGSIVLPSFAQIHELALGLEASKQPFVWVLRQPSSTASRYCSSPEQLSSLLPEGFQLRTEKQGLILSVWAPQLLILSHPSTAAFLTHCGWNSTLESVTRGLPMLGMPFFADQMMNCRMLVDQLQIAAEIPKGDDGLARRDAVSNAVTLVMGSAGEAMRQRAKELRDAAKQAVMDEHGCSHNNLTTFVDEIRKHAIYHAQLSPASHSSSSPSSSSSSSSWSSS